MEHFMSTSRTTPTRLESSEKQLSKFTEARLIGSDIYVVTLPSEKIRVYSTKQGGHYVLPEVFDICRRITMADLNYLRQGAVCGVYSGVRREWVVPFEFDFISGHENGLYIVAKDKKFGVYSSYAAKLVAPILFDRLELSGMPNLYRVSIKDKCGIFSILLNDYVVPIQYTGIVHRSGKTFQVWDNNRIGLFDAQTSCTVW